MVNGRRLAASRKLQSSAPNDTEGGHEVSPLKKKQKHRDTEESVASKLRKEKRKAKKAKAKNSKDNKEDNKSSTKPSRQDMVRALSWKRQPSMLQLLETEKKEEKKMKNDGEKVKRAQKEDKLGNKRPSKKGKDKDKSTRRKKKKKNKLEAPHPRPQMVRAMSWVRRPSQIQLMTEKEKSKRGSSPEKLDKSKGMPEGWLGEELAAIAENDEMEKPARSSLTESLNDSALEDSFSGIGTQKSRQRKSGGKSKSGKSPKKRPKTPKKIGKEKSKPRYSKFEENMTIEEMATLVDDIADSNDYFFDFSPKLGDESDMEREISAAYPGGQSLYNGVHEESDAERGRVRQMKSTSISKQEPKVPASGSKPRSGRSKPSNRSKLLMGKSQKSSRYHQTTPEVNLNGDSGSYGFSVGISADDVAENYSDPSGGIEKGKKLKSSKSRSGSMKSMSKKKQKKGKDIGLNDSLIDLSDTSSSATSSYPATPIDRKSGTSQSLKLVNSPAMSGTSTPSSELQLGYNNKDELENERRKAGGGNHVRDLMLGSKLDRSNSYTSLEARPSKTTDSPARRFLPPTDSPARRFLPPQRRQSSSSEESRDNHKGEDRQRSTSLRGPKSSNMPDHEPKRRVLQRSSLKRSSSSSSSSPSPLKTDDLSIERQLRRTSSSSASTTSIVGRDNSPLAQQTRRSSSIWSKIAVEKTEDSSQKVPTRRTSSSHGSKLSPEEKDSPQYRKQLRKSFIGEKLSSKESFEIPGQSQLKKTSSFGKVFMGEKVPSEESFEIPGQSQLRRMSYSRESQESFEEGSDSSHKQLPKRSSYSPPKSSGDTSRRQEVRSNINRLLLDDTVEIENESTDGDPLFSQKLLLPQRSTQSEKLDKMKKGFVIHDDDLSCSDDDVSISSPDSSSSDEDVSISSCSGNDVSILSPENDPSSSDEDVSISFPEHHSSSSDDDISISSPEDDSHLSQISQSPHITVVPESICSPILTRVKENEVVLQTNEKQKLRSNLGDFASLNHGGSSCSSGSSRQNPDDGVSKSFQDERMHKSKIARSTSLDSPKDMCGRKGIRRSSSFGGKSSPKVGIRKGIRKSEYGNEEIRTIRANARATFEKKNQVKIGVASKPRPCNTVTESPKRPSLKRSITSPEAEIRSSTRGSSSFGFSKSTQDMLNLPTPSRGGKRSSKTKSKSPVRTPSPVPSQPVKSRSPNSSISPLSKRSSTSGRPSFAFSKPRRDMLNLPSPTRGGKRSSRIKSKSPARTPSPVPSQPVKSRSPNFSISPLSKTQIEVGQELHGSTVQDVNIDFIVSTTAVQARRRISLSSGAVMKDIYTKERSPRKETQGLSEGIICTNPDNAPDDHVAQLKAFLYQDDDDMEGTINLLCKPSDPIDHSRPLKRNSSDSNNDGNSLKFAPKRGKSQPRKVKSLDSDLALTGNSKGKRGVSQIKKKREPTRAIRMSKSYTAPLMHNKDPRSQSHSDALQAYDSDKKDVIKFSPKLSKTPPRKVRSLDIDIEHDAEKRNRIYTSPSRRKRDPTRGIRKSLSYDATLRSKKSRLQQRSARTERRLQVFGAIGLDFNVDDDNFPVLQKKKTHEETFESKPKRRIPNPNVKTKSVEPEIETKLTTESKTGKGKAEAPPPPIVKQWFDSPSAINPIKKRDPTRGVRMSKSAGYSSPLKPQNQSKILNESEEKIAEPASEPRQQIRIPNPNVKSKPPKKQAESKAEEGKAEAPPHPIVKQWFDSPSAVSPRKKRGPIRGVRKSKSAGSSRPLKPHNQAKMLDENKVLNGWSGEAKDDVMVEPEAERRQPIPNPNVKPKPPKKQAESKAEEGKAEAPPPPILKQWFDSPSAVSPRKRRDPIRGVRKSKSTGSSGLLGSRNPGGISKEENRLLRAALGIEDAVGKQAEADSAAAKPEGDDPASKKVEPYKSDALQSTTPEQDPVSDHTSKDVSVETEKLIEDEDSLVKVTLRDSDNDSNGSFDEETLEDIDDDMTLETLESEADDDISYVEESFHERGFMLEEDASEKSEYEEILERDFDDESFHSEELFDGITEGSFEEELIDEPTDVDIKLIGDISEGSFEKELIDEPTDYDIELIDEISEGSFEEELIDEHTDYDIELTDEISEGSFEEELIDEPTDYDIELIDEISAGSFEEELIDEPTDVDIELIDEITEGSFEEELIDESIVANIELIDDSTEGTFEEELIEELTDIDISDEYSDNQSSFDDDLSFEEEIVDDDDLIAEEDHFEEASIGDKDVEDQTTFEESYMDDKRLEEILVVDSEDNEIPLEKLEESYLEDIIEESYFEELIEDSSLEDIIKEEAIVDAFEKSSLEDIIEETLLEDIFEDEEINSGDPSLIREEVEEVAGQFVKDLDFEENIFAEGKEESYQLEDGAIYEEIVEIGPSGEEIISEYVTEVLTMHDNDDYDDLPTELVPVSDDEESLDEEIILDDMGTNTTLFDSEAPRGHFLSSIAENEDLLFTEDGDIILAEEEGLVNEEEIVEDHEDFIEKEPVPMVPPTEQLENWQADQEKLLQELDEAPEEYPRTPKHVLDAILAEAETDYQYFKGVQAPDYHMIEFLAVVEEAVEIGKFTKKKEEVRETISTENQVSQSLPLLEEQEDTFDKPRKWKFEVPTLPALSDWQAKESKQQNEEIDKEIEEHGYIREDFVAGPEVAAPTPKNVMMAILSAGALDFKLRKVPERHKKAFESVSDAASSIARLTKLKENVIETVSIGEISLKKQEEWTPAGKPIEFDRSIGVLLANEASMMGKMMRRKEKEVVSNFNFQARFKMFENKFNVDEAFDEKGRKIFRTDLLLDQYIKDQKEEKGQADYGMNLIEQMEEHNKLRTNVCLPTAKLPLFGRKAAKTLTREEWTEKLSKGVAEKAWDRRYRLHRPKVELRIQKQCRCPYCLNPNPYQTHEYKRLQKLDREQKPQLTCIPAV